MLQEFARRGVALLISVALLSACVGQVEEEAAAVSTEQELANNGGGLSANGDACCAIDYRDGGKTIMCGERDGEWCCTADDSDCAHCSYYECEPPPAPSRTRTKAIRQKLAATFASP